MRELEYRIILLAFSFSSTTQQFFSICDFFSSLLYIFASQSPTGRHIQCQLIIFFRLFYHLSQPTRDRERGRGAMTFEVGYRGVLSSMNLRLRLANECKDVNVK